MPRHAKSTKLARDHKMIDGLQKHARELLSAVGPLGGLRTVDAVVKRFEEHLAAMRLVTETEAIWRQAVAREQRIEEELKELFARVAMGLVAFYGDRAPVLREFGLKPRKTPVIPIEVKVRAVERRRGTRKARGTMGKRQKRAIKGTR